MYRNGIGVFEGSIGGSGGEIKLTFKNKHMNDVLKTLQIRSVKTSERIFDVQYNSPRSLLESEIQFDSSNPLLSILKSIVGRATIKITDESDTIHEGIVLGIRESKDVYLKQQKFQIVKNFLELMIKGTDVIKVFEMSKLKGFDLGENKKLVLNLIETKNFMNRNSSVDIKVIKRKGKEEEEKEDWNLEFRYARTVSIWKPVFELMVKGNGVGELVIYSIIDNDSQYDWEKVDLNLLSELPFSHDVQLFEILKPDRQKVVLNPTYRRSSIPRKKGRRTAMSEEQEEESFEYEEELTASSITEIGLIKGSFRKFPIEHINLKKMDSSKVKINASKVKVEVNWLIYDSTSVTGFAKKEHPKMAVALISDDGFSMNGPITIYNEEGSYLGESIIDYIKQNTKKKGEGKDVKNIISYALDFQTEISRTETYSIKEILFTKLESSTLVIEIVKSRVTSYEINYYRKQKNHLRIIHYLYKSSLYYDKIRRRKKRTGKRTCNIDTQIEESIEIEKTEIFSEIVTFVIFEKEDVKSFMKVATGKINKNVENKFNRLLKLYEMMNLNETKLENHKKLMFISMESKKIVEKITVEITKIANKIESLKSELSILLAMLIRKTKVKEREILNIQMDKFKM